MNKPAYGLMEYRGITIEAAYDIPRANYSWTHPNYDGAPDSPTRHYCGYANSIEDCMDQIDMIMEECDDVTQNR